MSYDISKITAKAPIYVGKAKSIYTIEENEKEVLVEFRDDITARITSYNVCYTKLLRGQPKHRSYFQACSI